MYYCTHIFKKAHEKLECIAINCCFYVSQIMMNFEYVFNHLSKGGGYSICLYVYFFFKYLLTDTFLKNVPILITFFVVVVGKSHLHGGPILKIFLIARVKFVCLFNVPFGYNFHKNRTMTKKFWYVLNNIGLLYLWKIVIVSYIYLFTGHFKNFNTLIFSVHF